MLHLEVGGFGIFSESTEGWNFYGLDLYHGLSMLDFRDVL